ncbi:MAG: hypothetical protein RIM23_29690 [Coleofasciculus sp. G3-WIS-01]|uniref:hypothetical protein n=1 Tax=Coleofasciculus sp. G3-WIS-01 TaxID=3069528 RepID=UPI0032F359C9
MSDGMAFLTGAAFAGVALLFMMKGGDSLGITNAPPSQTAQLPQSNPYNPYNPTYGQNPQMPTQTTPGFAGNDFEQQQVTVERMRAMLEQQRAETEQLKAQVQNQQALIDNLLGQNNPNNPNNPNSFIPPRIEAAPPVTPLAQSEPDNSIISGLVWGLGGMAVTISGGVVVVGLLAVLSRQQQPRQSRTTYVVPHPYNALPYAPSARRRTEVIPPPLDDRQVDYVEYER